MNTRCSLHIFQTYGGNILKTIDILSVTAANFKGPRAARMFAEYQDRIRRYRKELTLCDGAHTEGGVAPTLSCEQAYASYEALCSEARRFLDSKGKHYITV